MKTKRHPAAAVPKAPGVKKKPAVKIPAGRQQKIDVSRKRPNEEADPGSADESSKEQSDSETEVRRTPPERSRLNSEDLSGSDVENNDQGSSDASDADSDGAENEAMVRDVRKIQELYGLKPTLTKKQHERELAVSKQKTKLSQLRTDNTEKSKMKLLVYRTLKDYLKGKGFKHLVPFYKDPPDDADVVMDLCERRRSELMLTDKQFHEAALMRLTDFTASKSPTFIWNLICALHMRSVLDQESTKKWDAYALKRDTAFSANESLCDPPTPWENIRELVPKIVNAIDEAGVAENNVTMYTQGTTKARNKTGMAIGVLFKSERNTKKKTGEVFKVTTSVYVVDPRIPYIFFHGSNLDSEHLKIIMNILNPEYSHYVKTDYTDLGLESVITACGAPPLSRAILDDLNNVATKQAEEAAELEGLKEEPEVVSSLKRKFLCASLLTGPHGFNKTNRFKIGHVSTADQSKIVIEFKSKSGNVGKMINRMVAAGADPVPYMTALSRKKTSVETPYTPRENTEN